MIKRSLLIKQGKRALTVGACEACNKEFICRIQSPAQAAWETEVLFQRHKCKALTEPAKPIARIA